MWNTQENFATHRYWSGKGGLSPGHFGRGTLSRAAYLEIRLVRHINVALSLVRLGHGLLLERVRLLAAWVAGVYRFPWIFPFRLCVDGTRCCRLVHTISHRFVCTKEMCSVRARSGLPFSTLHFLRCVCVCAQFCVCLFCLCRESRLVVYNRGVCAHISWSIRLI